MGPEEILKPLTLTKEDWEEIYYALKLKIEHVRQDSEAHPDGNEDDVDLPRWHKHLIYIADTIGPDGHDAAIRGVIGSHKIEKDFTKDNSIPHYNIQVDDSQLSILIDGLKSVHGEILNMQTPNAATLRRTLVSLQEQARNLFGSEARKDLITRAALKMEQANFTPRQRQQIIELLWDSLSQVKGSSGMRHTGWGMKTQTGLVESLLSIIAEKR